MKKVGTLGAIFRHPVKAMRGERLTACRVDAFGVYASVVTQGRVAEGDEVFVEEP